MSETKDKVTSLSQLKAAESTDRLSEDEAIANSYFDKVKELRILVSGKTGQGQSTLINGLLGAEVAREGAGAARCTTEVEVFKKEINGVPVVVFDSPGLQDNTSNEEEYIKSMKETCQELSLVLYCTKMTNTRLGDDDKKAMKKLTQAFGQGFWNHAVFVLTFANMERVDRWDERDKDDPSEEPHYSDKQAWKSLRKRRFEGRFKIWKIKLRQFLIHEVKVNSSVANGILVIPAGDHVIAYDSPTPLHLPDRDNWSQELWKACFFQGGMLPSISIDNVKELRILVTGKTGQGKSTLINGLLGAEVAREGAGAARRTTEVKEYKEIIIGVPVVVFDSAGLQDNTSNEEEYIRSMKETCQKLSLVLYCIKMINARLTDDDKNAMIKLTQAFGQEFWNHAVFVLTFANMEHVERWDDRDIDDDKIEPDGDDEEAWKSLKKRRFERRLQIWKEELRQFLINEVKVKSSIANGIPVVPAGDNKVSRRNQTPFRLPDRDNWFQEFWETCSFRAREQDLLLKINSHCMTAEDHGDDLSRWILDDQLAKVPAPPTKKIKDSKFKEQIEAMAKSPNVKELKKIFQSQEEQPTLTPTKPRSANPDKSIPVSVSPVEVQKADPKPKHNCLKPLQSDISDSKEMKKESKPRLQIDQEENIPSNESTVDQKCTEEISQSEDNSKGVVNTTDAPTESEAPNLNEVLKTWAPDNNKELRLLVTGKTGAGKSTLVNGLLGKEVAKEGAANFTRCTTEVTEYKAELHGVPVTVFDSPGLQDTTGNEDEYIADMKKKCQNLSLVLYCTKMTNKFLIAEDSYAILKLTAEFGQKFWEHAVLVLTFANMENITRRDDRDEDEGPEPDWDDDAAWEELEKKRFEGRLKKWKDGGFHKFLTEEVGVQSDIIKEIPVVPAGDYRKTKENRTPFRLPDRENWFDEFWKACSLRMRGKSDPVKELEHKIEIQELERQAEEYKKIIEKQAEHIKQEEKKKEEQSAKLDLLLDEKPLKSDFVRIFKDSAAKTIGAALDVKVNDMLPLPEFTDNNLILVFERWIDSDKNVTWKKIIQVCKDHPEKLGQAKVCVKRFFHQKGHEIFL